MPKFFWSREKQCPEIIIWVYSVSPSHRPELVHLCSHPACQKVARLVLALLLTRASKRLRLKGTKTRTDKGFKNMRVCVRVRESGKERGRIGGRRRRGCFVFFLTSSCVTIKKKYPPNKLGPSKKRRKYKTTSSHPCSLPLVLASYSSQRRTTQCKRNGARALLHEHSQLVTRQLARDICQSVFHRRIVQ